MSLLEKASLIVTPNAYKEDVLYSVVPNDRSGDLDVVRATTATRVNADGLIETVPRNLLTYSEQFDDASWVKSGTINITSNNIISPNGLQYADLLLSNDLTSYISQVYLGSIGIVYTNSFFIKNNNSTQSKLLIRQFSTIVDSTINWSGSVLTSITNTTGTTTFQNYGNGWYRIISTYTSIETSQRARIYPTLSTNQSVYLWGAQLEAGSTATEYFPTTTRLNIPRIDYTNGSCPSILVEPQRTNLTLYSEQFDNAYWGKQSGATVTANTAISPDGTQNADTINLVSGSTISRIEKAVTAYTASTAYTLTFYLKNILLTSGQTFLMRFEGNGFDLSGTIDLANNTNTVSLTGTAVSGFVSGSERATLEECENGWVRCSIGLTTGTNSGNINVYLITNVDANRSFYAWGAQLEAGSNATSYIPTIASTVTRNADVISKTGIDDLIGQSEGTIVLDFELQPNNINGNYLFSLSDGTSSNLIRSEIFILSPTVSQFRTGLTTSGVGQGDNFTTITQLRNKMAISYSLNNFKFFINGVLVYTDTTATIPATSGFYLGNRIGLGNIIGANYKQAILFKTQLTDQECINLTTL